MNRIHKIIASFLAIALLWIIPASSMAGRTTQPSQSQSQTGIPPRPGDLKYPRLDYTPPKKEKYRRTLPNGSVGFFVEDHTLPLINISITVRTGSYLEPAGKQGLADLVGSQMRAGGTTSKTAEQFDEDADFLAAAISSFIGGTAGTAGLNCLAKDIDSGLSLFVDMLKNPRFQPERLALAKSQILQQMERRNDSTTVIESREWGRLMRGENHFTTRQTTKASIESITREDLIAFHKQYYQPGAFIFAVSGDFKTDEMIAKLDASMKGWEAAKPNVAAVPRPSFTPTSGVYTVHKKDVNQGRVSIGHVGSTRDNPDSYALQVMNDILGGGGFTSRIMSRVRSDEGLAYSAGSGFGLGVYYPGDFRASFQSKSGGTPQAMDIVLEEINHIRTTKVSAEELQTTINSFVDTFSLSFASAGQIASTFANDEYTGRAADYWDTYRAKIKAVTADDVLRVAQKYLMPDKLVILVVGNIDDISKGNADKPQYSLAKIAGSGTIHKIPLPDPMTMVYPSPSQ